MIVVPLLIVTGILTFIFVITWWIKRRRRPNINFLIKMVIVFLTFITGIFYLIFPIFNLLIKYGIIEELWRINISEEEILGTAIIVGLIFFFVGLDELVKLLKRRR